MAPGDRQIIMMVPKDFFKDMWRYFCYNYDFRQDARCCKNKGKPVIEYHMK